MDAIFISRGHDVTDDRGPATVDNRCDTASSSAASLSNDFYSREKKRKEKKNTPNSGLQSDAFFSFPCNRVDGILNGQIERLLR